MIATADIVVWASSLVHPDILGYARAGAEIVDSLVLPLEGVSEIYRRAATERLTVARVHTGDPSLWGAIQEQRELCEAIGLPHETVPGVTAVSAVAALVDRELTVPEVAQSVVLTRLEGGTTPMPEGETVRAFASHQTTIALYLSAARAAVLQTELLAGGYPPDTPCVVAHAATWPQQLVVRCTVAALAATCQRHGLRKHTLVLVGRALTAHGTRSHLYHPNRICPPEDSTPTGSSALGEPSAPRDSPGEPSAPRDVD